MCVGAPILTLCEVWGSNVTKTSAHSGKCCALFWTQNLPILLPRLVTDMSVWHQGVWLRAPNSVSWNRGHLRKTVRHLVSNLQHIFVITLPTLRSFPLVHSTCVHFMYSISNKFVQHPFANTCFMVICSWHDQGKTAQSTCLTQTTCPCLEWSWQNTHWKYWTHEPNPYSLFWSPKFDPQKRTRLLPP